MPRDWVIACYGSRIKTLITVLISLACISSETHNLQRVFLCILYTMGGGGEGGVIVPGFPCRDRVESGTKNRCMIEATPVLRRKLTGKIKFGAFPKRVGPRILSLESVDYFGTSAHY